MVSSTTGFVIFKGQKARTVYCKEQWRWSLVLSDCCEMKRHDGLLFIYLFIYLFKENLALRRKSSEV